MHEVPLNLVHLQSVYYLPGPKLSNSPAAAHWGATWDSA